MPNQKFGRSAVRLAIVLKKGTIVPDMSTTGMDQLGRPSTDHSFATLWPDPS